MNELPPSPPPGSRDKVASEPAQQPPVSGEKEGSPAIWQSKQVERSKTSEQQPLDESKVPTSPVRKKSLPGEKGAYGNEGRKSKSPTQTAGEAATPVTFERIQEEFKAVDFPSMSGYEQHFGKVLDLIGQKFKGLGENHPKRAHLLFHKALMLKRMGKSETEYKASLELAWKFDQATIIKQLSLAQALSLLSQQKKNISHNELFAAMAKLRPACNDKPYSSLMSRLKLTQTLMGVFEKPGIELFQAPYLFPNYYNMLSVMTEEPEIPVVEATFSNGLELSFLLKEELYSNDEMSDLELAVAEILWLAQFAKDPFNKKLAPRNWCRHLKVDRYLDLGKVWISTTFRDKEQLEEHLTGENLANVRDALARLSNMSLGPNVSYMRAFIAMVLGRCIEMGIYEKSAKVCADYFSIAAKHPAFISLLPKAAEYYQSALCYKEASVGLEDYLQKALLQDHERERALGKLDEVEELELQQQLFLKQSVDMEDTVTSDAKAGKKRLAKGKRKFGKASKKNGSSSKSKKASVNSSSSKDVRKSPPQTEQSETGLYREARALSPPVQEDVEEPLQIWWSKEAHQSMTKFYEARSAGKRAEEDTHIHEAAAKATLPGEQFAIHYQAAWHYLEQVKLLPKFRTIKNKGQPAGIDHLCRTGRKHLAKAFSGLTGVHVTATVSPDDMKQSLSQCLPPQGMDQTQEARFREQLRMLMSSFGHSYSYQADVAPGNRELGYNTREFYKLKRVAKPFYSKKTNTAGVQASGVQLRTREEFEELRAGKNSP